MSKEISSAFHTWFNLPGVVVRDDRLTATDKLVYAEINTSPASGGWCSIDRHLIRQDLGITDRALDDSVTRLEACGWLHRRFMQGSNGKTLDEQATTDM
jgi:hypothetical protein